MLTAQEIQAKRQANHMTQAQLAQATGIEPSLIARYEQGDVPIPAEHAEKMQAAWQPTMTAPSAGQPYPVKPTVKKAESTKVGSTKVASTKTASAKTPSVSQWLQSVAHDSPDRRPARAAPVEPAADTTPSRVVQASAQVTSDKQRRVALNNLLTAALGQIDKLFAEDKQIRAMAESIEQLDPVHRQVVLGFVNQLEQLDPASASKARSGPDQMVQALKDPSAYVTVLNYLEAALQLLKQAELADRPLLMTRLQSLSEFDLNTVQMITKRYQTSPRSAAPERAPEEDRAHSSADS